MNQIDKDRLAQLRSYGTFTREQVEEYVVLVKKEEAQPVEVEAPVEIIEVRKSKKR